MPVIPTTWEVDPEGSQFEATEAKLVRPGLKNKRQTDWEYICGKALA
jgi:hypothetical protein